MTKRAPVKFMFDVPIWDVRVRVLVSDDRFQCRRDHNHVFGEYDCKDDWDAMCSNDGKEFGLFFAFETFTLPNLVHELYHLANGIIESRGAKVEEETGAILIEWLMEKIEPHL